MSRLKRIRKRLKNDIHINTSFIGNKWQKNRQDKIQKRRKKMQKRNKSITIHE